MFAQRQRLLIPQLMGRDNYREWSQKMELILRIRKWWSVVLSPPRPIKTTTDNRENFIFVASHKRIYEQCPNSLSRYVNLFICRYIDAPIMSPNYRKLSVPRLWHKLRCTFGSRKLFKSKVQKKCKKM